VGLCGLLLIGGCGGAEDEGPKIDLSEQVSKPNPNAKPTSEANLSPQEKRAKRLGKSAGN